MNILLLLFCFPSYLDTTTITMNVMNGVTLNIKLSLLNIYITPYASHLEIFSKNDLWWCPPPQEKEKFGAHWHVQKIPQSNHASAILVKRNFHSQKCRQWCTNQLPFPYSQDKPQISLSVVFTGVFLGEMRYSFVLHLFSIMMDDEKSVPSDLTPLPIFPFFFLPHLHP